MVNFKKLLIIVIIIICFLFTSCAPAKFTPKTLPNLKFEKTPSYSVDLSSIIKPDKPIYIWMDENFKEVPKDQAKYLILTKKEYAKYVTQLKIKNTYKDIIGQQEILINQYIVTINSLKEYITLEKFKVEEYRQLWIDSENAYRYEKHLHKIDNAINKGMFMSISIGSLVAAILIVL